MPIILHFLLTTNWELIFGISGKRMTVSYNHNYLSFSIFQEWVWVLRCQIQGRKYSKEFLPCTNRPIRSGSVYYRQFYSCTDGYFQLHIFIYNCKTIYRALLHVRINPGNLDGKSSTSYWWKPGPGFSIAWVSNLSLSLSQWQLSLNQELSWLSALKKPGPDV